MANQQSNGPIPRAARSLINHPVTCTIKETGLVCQCICANISESGMFLDSPTRMAPSGDVEFKFIEHGIVLIQGEARIVRVVDKGDTIGLGVFFTSLDEQARRLIARVIELNSDAAREAPVPAPERTSDCGVSLDTD